MESYLPRFLRRFPSATIHYRWANSPEASLHWPTPIHDTLFAYDFLIRHLSPPPDEATGTVLQRRPVYVYGSYLGASLASSLALTESHTHQPVAIRGLLAFNGIFNWTTLLPGHPNNKLMLDEMPDMDSVDECDKDVRFAKDLMPSHFDQPANLFDPFASPVLLFHTAGMLVPTSFTERSPAPNMSQGFLDAVNQLSAQSSSTPDADDPYDQAYVYSDPEDPPPPSAYEDMETDTEPEDTNTDTGTSSPAGSSSDSLAPSNLKAPRRGYVTFPPRASSLKIPETLLIHTTAPPGPTVPAWVQGQRRRLAMWKRLKAAENNFGTQAIGLAGLMRRSVNLYELRERAKWDIEFTGWETEALRRVQVQDVGAGAGANGFSLGQRGDEVAARWLASRLG